MRDGVGMPCNGKLFSMGYGNGSGSDHCQATSGLMLHSGLSLIPLVFPVLFL